MCWDVEDHETMKKEKVFGDSKELMLYEGNLIKLMEKSLQFYSNQTKVEFVKAGNQSDCDSVNIKLALRKFSGNNYCPSSTGGLYL